MSKLDIIDVQGIGKIGKEKLQRIDVFTAEELIKIGSKKAFLLVKERVDEGVCLSFLYALEAGCQGVRTPNLSQEKKDELKQFYRSIN